MDAIAAQVDLIRELKMIQGGKCIWCNLGLPHPLYSQCAHKVEKRDHRRDVDVSGFELQRGYARASA